MALKVRIKSETFETKSGTSFKRGPAGVQYSIREQAAFLLAGELILPLVLSLGRDQPVHAAGLYEVADESFTVDDYGALKVGKKGLVLKPLAKSADQSKAA